MKGYTQNIIKKIFKADSLENISIEELKQMTEEYPSFSIGHYLLSKKLSAQKATPAFQQQSQKTSLYFPNPFWLQWLLEHENDITISVDEKQQFEKPNEETQPVIEESINNYQPGPINETIIPIQVEKETASVKEEALIFEPYHTIDYFASQGIKLSLDENPKDKLGIQLRSFTEWLKTMKKLPQKTLESDMDETERETIVNEASHSVEGKEIITEAMAEVLLKQGKTVEASEVYHKLSLLNPDKSSYFAAKSENLKVH
ncbi:MAG: hypothetical protein JST96_15330 [Bacteroidetes bacterium]|nr:hypothetical protein [Bacteroidota bacterium]